MKKSELKNIIRESIKELINEQGANPPGKKIYVYDSPSCDTSTPPAPIIVSRCGRVNGQTPQVGDEIQIPASYSSHYTGMYGNIAGRVAKIHSVVGCLAQHNVNPTEFQSGTCSSTPTSSCDNTMNGSCAQQWLPPSMNWNNMTNFACTGNNTYSGLISNRTAQVTSALQAQPIGLPSGGVNTLLTGANSPFTSWSAISGWVNQTNQSAQSGGAGSISNPGQLKRRIAQLKWAECMNTECSC